MEKGSAGSARWKTERHSSVRPRPEGGGGEGAHQREAHAFEGVTLLGGQRTLEDGEAHKREATPVWGGGGEGAQQHQA